MMGRQTGDQSQLFYLFNLEERIPANHLLRRVNPIVTRVLADLRVAMARGPEEAEAAFATIPQERADAVVVEGIFFSKSIAELALKYRLPTASVVRQFAEAGGLLSYGADIRDIYRRSATLVHKILQGTKPSDLPVELPTRFELVLNMKTAKALGIDVPWFFQQRADEVIE
jgi:putative tryptophan/tyrosine transport system substrate-binding protein